MIIYKITNKVNGKVYVGQTTEGFERRWTRHKSNSRNEKARKHSAIAAAIHKYGVGAFECEVIDSADTIDYLNYLEKHYIQIFDCVTPNGYNIKHGGNNNANMHEESKKKISVANKGRAAWNKGINMPSVSEKMKGNTNNAKPVECITLNVIFDSAKEAAELLGLTPKTVSNICCGRSRGSRCGLKFRYVD